MKLTKGLTICFSLVHACHASRLWTPADFEWTALPGRRRHGLYANASSKGGTDISSLPWDIGIAWQPLAVAVDTDSAVTAIQGCLANDGSASGTTACVLGLASTLIAIGSAFETDQAAGWFARASNTWMQSGLEEIALETFSRRAETHQGHFEAAVHDILRRSFGRAPELLGHANHTHRLGHRDATDYLHPRVPLFRFSHPALGLMDLAAREHSTGVHFTLSYANHGLDRRQSFQHERMSSHLFQGRFDATAALADPIRPAFDAAAAYPDILDAVSCFATGSGWPDGKVLSVQMYDNTHRATFGFASLGIFENSDADAALMAFEPVGLPLPVNDC